MLLIPQDVTGPLRHSATIFHNYALSQTKSKQSKINCKFSTSTLAVPLGLSANNLIIDYALCNAGPLGVSALKLHYQLIKHLSCKQLPTFGKITRRQPCHNCVRQGRQSPGFHTHASDWSLLTLDTKIWYFCWEMMRRKEESVQWRAGISLGWYRIVGVTQTFWNWCNCKLCLIHIYSWSQFCCWFHQL